MKIWTGVMVEVGCWERNPCERISGFDASLGESLEEYGVTVAFEK